MIQSTYTVYPYGVHTTIGVGAPGTDIPYSTPYTYCGLYLISFDLVFQYYFAMSSLGLLTYNPPILLTTMVYHFIQGIVKWSV